MSCKMEHQTSKRKDAWEIECSHSIYATEFLWLPHLLNRQRTKTLRILRTVVLPELSLQISVVSLNDVGNSYQGKIGVFLYFFAIKAIK